MSTVTDYTKRQYQLQDTSIKITPSAVDSLPAECRGGVLKLQGEPYAAAPPSFANALDSQMTTGQTRWSSVKIGM